MCEAAIAEGIRVVLATVPPRAINDTVLTTFGTHTTLMSNPTDQATWVALNALITAYANPTLRPVWLWDRTSGTVDDPDTGHVLDYMTSDGLHYSSLGCYHSGKALSTLLQTMIAPGVWFNIDPDVDNLMPGGDFAGTGGSGTGSIATGWNLERWAPFDGAGVTATGSKEADGSNSKQVITFAVVGDGHTAGVLGATKLLNGTFGSAANLTLGAGYSVTGGQLVHDATGGFPFCDFALASNLVAGRTYRITYDVIGSNIGSFFALANHAGTAGSAECDAERHGRHRQDGRLGADIEQSRSPAAVHQRRWHRSTTSPSRKSSPTSIRSRNWLLSRGGYPGSFTLPGGISEGDWLQCQMRVELSEWDGWQELRLDTRILDSGDAVLINAIGALPDVASPSQIFPEATTVWLTTEPFQVPAGAAKFVFFLWLGTLAYGQTGSGAVKSRTPSCASSTIRPNASRAGR